MLERFSTGTRTPRDLNTTCVPVSKPQGGAGDAAKLYDSGELGVDVWAAAYADGKTWSTMSSPSRRLCEVWGFEQVGGYGLNGGLGAKHGTNRKDHAAGTDFVFQYGYWEGGDPPTDPRHPRG